MIFKWVIVTLKLVACLVGQGDNFTIAWIPDSLDWKPGISGEAIMTRLSNVESGAILLFHNDTPQTAKILGQAIDAIREKDLTPVPVSELIVRENFDIRYDGRQIPKEK